MFRLEAIEWAQDTLVILAGGSNVSDGVDFLSSYFSLHKVRFVYNTCGLVISFVISFVSDFAPGIVRLKHARTCTSDLSL